MGNTALNPGYGGDLISDEDVTGVAQVSTTTTGSGTVSGTSFSLAVTSTTGFASSGYVWLWSAGSSSWVLVNYSGVSGGNTFTGCTVDKITLSSGSGQTAPTWSASAVVAQALIKLPRSKVILGSSGVDDGDVSSTNPMPTKEVSSSNWDILGVGVVGSRNNQIEISFFSAPGATLITDTVTSTGSVTQSSGHTLYSTGAGTTSSAKGVSVASTTYRPAHELYAYFTAGFTTPTSASSYQRIGIYDATNGFSIGYSGTTFGLWKRTNSADTFTSRSSWNGDPLDGSASSKFTRAGVPEAINLTYSNLFRIRFAWLGSASILFETFSPDGAWVTFHTIRQPNSSLNPSVTTPNLPMTVDVSKTSADATVLSVATACWAAGTTSDYVGVNETITDQTLASLSRSVIVGKSSSGGGTYNNVKVTPSGSLTTAIGDITGVVGQNTMANSLPVTLASDQSTVTVDVLGASSAVNTATIAGIGATSLAAGFDGYETAIFIATGTWNGNIAVQGSVDNTTWVTIPLLYSSGSWYFAGYSTIYANVPMFANISGYKYLRFNASPWTSGSSTVKYVYHSLSLPNPTAGLLGTSSQGSANSTANAWPVKTTDGTNVAAVKAASTAAVAADPALVVSVSPNTPAKIWDGTTTAAVTAGNALKVDNSAVTQPISAASLPLPTGAATAAKQPALGTAGTASTDVITVQGIASMTALKVDGSGVTQPVSAASLPLPSGAATSAKQPALGTAGTASADVITVQGIASMTALKVDGSAVTQPVSGTVTANAGTGTFAISAASLPLPSGAATSANQTTLGSQTTKVNDGTNTAAVKAASTSAVAADPALVVAISPVSNTTRDYQDTGTLSFSSNTTSNLTVTGFSTLCIEVTGTYVGTVQVKGNADSTGSPLIDLYGYDYTNKVMTNQITTGFTARWVFDVSDLTIVQIGMTGYVSGTAALGYSISASPSTTAGVPITDGRNVATVRAANSAAQATDTALVVAVSPNNSVAVTGTVTANAGTGTFAVSAASLPLPSGAATAAKQPALGTAGTPSADVLTVQGTSSMTALKVDGSAVTQPVSGTVTANAGTGTFAISAASLPLPTGAATSANLTTIGNQTTKINDGTNTAAVKAALTAAVASDPALVVAISPNNSLTVSNPSVGTPGSAVPTSATLIAGSDGTNLLAPRVKTTAAASGDPSLVVAVSPINSVAVTAASLPLPTGAATAAKQPALGTAGTPSADVITVQGATSMTALKVDGSGSTQPVSGTVTVTQATAANLNANITNISGTVSLPTGASTSALQTTGNTTLSTISSNQTSGAQLTKISADSTTIGSLPLTATKTSGTRVNLDVTIRDTVGNALGDSNNQLHVQVTDGTNTPAVKVNNGTSYQPAGVSDNALVVAISPSNAIRLIGQGNSNEVPVRGNAQQAQTSDNSLVVQLSPNTGTKLMDGTNISTFAKVTSGAVSPAASDNAVVVSLSPNSAAPTVVAANYPSYPGANTSITISISGLVNTAGSNHKQSTFVDNTSTLYEDALIVFKYLTGGTVTTTGYVIIYGYASIDGGTTYSGAVTGTDGNYTIATPTELIPLMSFPANAASRQYVGGPFSFCRMYGIDRLPPRWGVVVGNFSGGTLGTTAGANTVSFMGVRGRFGA